MSNQHRSSDCTSADFEKVAINRFLTLTVFLPQGCKVYREPWDCSTVLCLDFANCPHFLDLAREQAQLLISVSQELGLANSVIFRIGNKFMGWKTVPPKLS
jgi:hypothetical protein